MIDIITIMAKATVGVMLAVMLIVVVLEVAGRYFVGISFPWANEMIRFMMVWTAFVGGAVAYKDGGLVFFDLVLNKLPAREKAVMKVVINTVICAFCAYMLYMSWQTTFSPGVRTQVAIGLQIPMTIPYFGITLGLALLVVYSLYNYRKLIPALTDRGG